MEGDRQEYIPHQLYQPMSDCDHVHFFHPFGVLRMLAERGHYPRIFHLLWKKIAAYRSQNEAQVLRFVSRQEMD